MLDDNDLLNYIELISVLGRSEICKIQVQNYEEFWQWLTIHNDNDEFIVYNVGRGEKKYIKNKIIKFTEKTRLHFETGRSKVFNNK